MTISTDNSNVKNQFWGPSRGVPLWALFFFSPFFPFFSRFLSFSCFLFFHFSLFLFISSFFDFLMFFIFLVHFFRREKFLLSVFLVFLQMFFLAGVSIRV